MNTPDGHPAVAGREDDLFSPRHLLADSLPGRLTEIGLAPGEPSAARQFLGHYYVVTFTSALLENAEVRVYGEDYLCVIWYGAWRQDFRRLGAQGSRIFGGVEAALAFCDLAFARGLPDEALAVPERERKPRRTRA